MSMQRYENYRYLFRFLLSFPSGMALYPVLLYGGWLCLRVEESYSRRLFNGRKASIPDRESHNSTIFLIFATNLSRWKITTN